MKRVWKVVRIVFLGLLLAIAGFVFFSVRSTNAKMSYPDEPGPAVTASQDPAVIERGRYLVYGPAHCSQCHGDYPRERPQENTSTVPLSGGFEFAMGPIGTTWSANLTPSGIGGLSDAQVARAITTGVQHDGQLSILMRYSAANLSLEDLTAVLSYLRSLAPVPRDVKRGSLTLLGKVAFAGFALSPDRKPLPAHVAEGTEPTLERGGYLAENVTLCVACHSTYDPSTFEPTGPKAGGGTAEASHGPDKDKEFAPPNLTSSPKGITGKMSEDEFVMRIKSGRAYPSSIMPWENFGRMTESDMRSIYRYLKSLPPVDKDTGPSYRDVGWKP